MGKEEMKTVANEEEFKRMKKEYFGMVLKAGQLDEQQGELKQEVVAANITVARLQMDLMSLTGGRQGKPANPWQVGVPYGSKVGRVGGGERDRYGRPIGDGNKGGGGGR